MAIQAQQPAQIPSAPPTSGADVLALLTGKPVDARVLNITPDGLTQLLLGLSREGIKLALPKTFMAGTILTLQIKDGQLVVQPQGAGSGGAAPAVPAPPSSVTSLPPPQLPVADSAARPAVALPVSPQAAAPNNAAPLPTPLSPASALQAQLQASFSPARAMAPMVQPQMPTGALALPTGPGNAPAAGAPVPTATLSPTSAPTLQPPASGAVAPMPQVGTAPTKPEGLGALLANLATLEGRLAQLPAPVANAARQFLGQQINLAKSRLTGERLQQAILGAGILGASGDEEGAPVGQLGVPAKSDELKSSLLMLRKALLAWVGPERAEASAALAKALPPLRSSAPRAARIDASLLHDGDVPEESGKSLLEQTDAALSRLRPGHAGTAEHLNRVDQAQAALRNEWAGQLPLFLGQEAGLAQFQITRDGGSSGSPEQRPWQVRFAINFSVIGEVGAHVLLRGRRASVTIWAERSETADALEGMLSELMDAFTAVGLETGSIQCRQGVPRPAPVAAGGLVDSVR